MIIKVPSFDSHVLIQWIEVNLKNFIWKSTVIY